jgi:long-chain acyl-CoA synthetase
MYPGVYAKSQPDKVAIIHPASEATVSYRQLNERSNQLAHLLRSFGLQRGDHVALLLENNPVFFEIVWACLRSGLQLTPINYHLAPQEAAYIVADCDAQVLLASANLEHAAELARLSDCAIKLSIGGALEGFVAYEQARQDQPTHNVDNEILGGVMMYSSGTTGRPKGVARPLLDTTPEEGNPAVQGIGRMFGFDTHTMYLSTAPMYHGAPLGYSNATISMGGTVVMMDRFDAEESLRLIEQYRITHSQWVPTMFIRLLKLPEAVRNRYDTSSQTHAIHAAAPCPVDVKRQMIEWWGPIIEEYYASTEAIGYTKISSTEWLDHPGSVGRSAGLPFHICDDDGHELPIGESGTIYAEIDPQTRVSYHKDPEKTQSACHPFKDTWMSVGDVGYLDESGYLYLTDRKSFMIISGGVNIYPQQIENTLALHPQLVDVAVIGVPHPELGEVAMGLVQLAPGNQPSAELEDALKAFVEERLGKQLVPRSFEFVSELPRTPTGKLNKKALRAPYWPEPS